MIRLLTGAPGSGKSYFAVYKIRELLEKENVIVCSNVDGLTQETFKKNNIKNAENYINIERDLKDSFFEYKNFKKFCERIRKVKGDRKIVFFIDEAQRWLGVKKRLSQEVIFTFDYHRHLNVDFYLITQHSRKIHFDISCLAEYEIRAQRQKLNLLNRFKYFFIVDNFVFQKKTLPKRAEIFSLYKSFEVPSDNTFSERSALLRYVLFAVILFVFSFALYFYFRKSFQSLALSSSSLKKQPESHLHVSSNSSNSSLSSSVPTFILLPDNSLLICEYDNCLSYSKNQLVRYKNFVFSNPKTFCEFFHCL